MVGRVGAKRRATGPPRGTEVEIGDHVGQSAVCAPTSRHESQEDGRSQSGGRARRVPAGTLQRRRPAGRRRCMQWRLPATRRAGACTGNGPSASCTKPGEQRVWQAARLPWKGTVTGVCPFPSTRGVFGRWSRRTAPSFAAPPLDPSARPRSCWVHPCGPYARVAGLLFFRPVPFVSANRPPRRRFRQ